MIAEDQLLRLEPPLNQLRRVCVSGHALEPVGVQGFCASAREGRAPRAARAGRALRSARCLLVPGRVRSERRVLLAPPARSSRHGHQLIVLGRAHALPGDLPLRALRGPLLPMLALRRRRRRGGLLGGDGRLDRLGLPQPRPLAHLQRGQVPAARHGLQVVRAQDRGACAQRRGALRGALKLLLTRRLR